MPPKPESANQQRERHVISFSLTPETVWLISAMQGDFSNNRSAVVNAAVRQYAESLGITYQPPESTAMYPIEIVHNGVPLPIIAHQGKHYVVAPPAGEFAIRLTNRTADRKEFVVSVDGIDIIDGTAASFQNRGYILRMMQSSDILGWRRGADKVAAFEFVGEGKSYAEQTGRGTNKGVISVAIFAEQPHRTNGVVLRGMQTNCDKSFLGAHYSCSIGGNGERMMQTKGGLDLGTGYGKETVMRTGSTTFTRASSTPETTWTLYYATADALRAMGVPVPAVAAGPNPWPGNGPAVPAPPGWTP